MGSAVIVAQVFAMLLVLAVGVAVGGSVAHSRVADILSDMSEERSVLRKLLTEATCKRGWSSLGEFADMSGWRHSDETDAEYKQRTRRRQALEDSLREAFGMPKGTTD